MNYFITDKSGNIVPADMISLSPTGRYFVAKADSYVVFHDVRTDGENVYGTAVTRGVDYSDDTGYPVHFQSVAWYEAYGFVKIIFSRWDTFEKETARLYFDRDLYNRKKQELHGS